MKEVNADFNNVDIKDFSPPQKLQLIGGPSQMKRFARQTMPNYHSPKMMAMTAKDGFGGSSPIDEGSINEIERKPLKLSILANEKPRRITLPVRTTFRSVT